MEDPVVVVELRGGGRGRVVLDSAAGSGAGAAATVVVVAMEGETGSAAFMAQCIPTGFRKRLFLVRVIRSDLGAD